MKPVSLSPTQLAALDVMIKTLEAESSSSEQMVSLGRLVPPMLTTVVIAATNVTGAGTRVTPEDARTIAEVEKLVGRIKTEVSLAELLALRGSAAAPKRKAP
jgi:hypothetical protein